MKIALSIAGSDSIGGAGVQADLKAFASLGVYGCSVITCITAQNTTGIRKVIPVEAEMIREQLLAVLDDTIPGAAKTGAIYSEENAAVISEILSDKPIPLIVDPVLEATTGANLAGEGLKRALIEKLLPICNLVTPNTAEAEALTGQKIIDFEKAEKAAEILIKKGVSGVLIKGIVEGNTIKDFLAMKDGTKKSFMADRIEGVYHGTGCVLSALIAGHISLGRDMGSAITEARNGLLSAMTRGKAIGKGIMVIDPLQQVIIDAQKNAVIEKLASVRERIEKEINIRLLPEVGSNLGFSIQYPVGESDVAGFTGRIIRDGRRTRVIGCPQFGASKHVARIILAALKHDQKIRSAMNIKFNKENLAACNRAGLSMSSFSRDEEPKDVSTMSWGVDNAIKKSGFLPDIVWDSGGKDKEPMIRILGKDPEDVLDKLIRISNNLSE